MNSVTSTTEILARAIDVCALRQAVHSANIANANVDGYKRLEAVIAESLDTAAHSESGQASLFQNGVAPVASETAVVMATNSTVKLDEEMAAMARNALRYQTLLSIYERSSGLLRMAIHEGREA